MSCLVKEAEAGRKESVADALEYHLVWIGQYSRNESTMQLLAADNYREPKEEAYL